jgi:hypothetical protein
MISTMNRTIEIFIISLALGLVEFIFHRQLGEVDNNRRGIA